MIEIIDSNRLIEQVIEKHNGFLKSFNSEFSELDGKLAASRQQFQEIKKEKVQQKQESLFLMKNITCFSTRQKN
jgi:hypothetical protein